MLEDTGLAPAEPGIRASSGVAAAWYNPERDYALLSPHILKAVFQRLYPPPVDDPDYAALLKEYSEEEQRELFCRAATVLYQCQCLFMENNNPEARLRELATHGGFFSQLPGPVRLAVLAKLGEFFLGTLFSGTRDLTPVDGRPQYERILASTLAEGARVSGLFRKGPHGDSAAAEPAEGS